LGQTTEDQVQEESKEEFPAFKSNPVTISGFLHEATIMLSKEKPKKIGMLGNNG
jgi:hypothetical protein